MFERNKANYAPLTPVDFLRRSAEVYPGKVAVIHGEMSYTYREFEVRCRRFASVLAARGVGRGDTVAVMAPNVPALLELAVAVGTVAVDDGALLRVNLGGSPQESDWC